MYKKIILKSEPDRYGFSELIARRLGFKKVRRSYCAWVHYWVWWDAESPEELGYGGFDKGIRIVCSDEKQRKMLQQYGHKDVVVGGVPFAYVPPAYVERLEASLLVFLPHSLDYLGVSLCPEKYLDVLATFLPDFSRIDVSIYSHEYDMGTQKLECEKRGLNVIQGSRPDDANALFKLRALLERYEYVTSPYISAHILYAAFCGCKVSITRPIFNYGENHFMRDPYVQKFPFLARLFDVVSTEKYISEKYPWLITDHPSKATERVLWAAKEIGAEFVLDDRNLKLALGWNVLGRIHGPIVGTIRRFSRLFLS